jgi:drug/metabolite transporter (DMT)-like permease
VLRSYRLASLCSRLSLGSLAGSQRLARAASTGLIFATAPVWGLLLGAVLGLERPTIRGILGLALSVVGVAVVVFEGLGSGGDSLVGDLLVLIASVGVGGYTVLSMPLLERHTPLAVAG